MTAHRGTLFLDELAELDPAVQPKLLRVLETREVVPLGDTRGRAIDVGLCAATLRDIPERVAQGKFREDLYYRMGRPAVRLPPLRQRREEIPFLIQRALAAVGPELDADAALVEMCLLRPWPGNVRELIGEVRRAGHTARDKGRARRRGRRRIPPARRDRGDAARRGRQRHARRPAPGPAPQPAAALARPQRSRPHVLIERAQRGHTCPARARENGRPATPRARADRMNTRPIAKRFCSRCARALFSSARRLLIGIPSTRWSEAGCFDVRRPKGE